MTLERVVSRHLQTDSIQNFEEITLSETSVLFLFVCAKISESSHSHFVCVVDDLNYNNGSEDT